jgi:hypothetical protein
LDGVTATTAELNYVDGVTSAIQTQIDTKAPLASPTFTGTVTVPGLTTTANVLFGDNDKAIFGAGSDLQIYSDGTQSIIQEDGPGALYIQGTHLNFNNAAGNASYITAVDGGAVTLFSGGSAKLATTSTGITVSGAVGAPSSENFYRIKFQDQGGIANDVGIGQPDADSLAFNFTSTAGGHIAFFAGSSEKVRIDSSGQLLIGCTGQTGDAPNSDGFLFQQIGNLKIRVNSDGQACQQYYSPTGGTSSPVGSITVGASSTAFNTSSDQRLKENIADADDAGSRVDAIQVRQFDWIADGSHQDYGMVAQELQSVAPEAVTGDGDSDEIMGVDYSKLVPMLVKEIQSLRARVAQLENN